MKLVVPAGLPARLIPTRFFFSFRVDPKIKDFRIYKYILPLKYEYSMLYIVFWAGQVQPMSPQSDSYTKNKWKKIYLRSAIDMLK